ncbi:MAG: hypothetical protein J2P19_25415 [Pseudonocardia sp.]|nr:hypothetical protein [Pseudonocardia sp.]
MSVETTMLKISQDVREILALLRGYRDALTLSSYDRPARQHDHHTHALVITHPEILVRHDWPVLRDLRQPTECVHTNKG